MKIEIILINDLSNIKIKELINMKENLIKADKKLINIKKDHIHNLINLKIIEIKIVMEIMIGNIIIMIEIMKTNKDINLKIKLQKNFKDRLIKIIIRGDKIDTIKVKHKLLKINIIQILDKIIKLKTAMIGKDHKNSKY